MTYRRYAYCVGANGPQNLEYGSLKYAEKDAERLARALAAPACNFNETKWEVAADPRRTLAALSQFVKRCQSSDLLVIHFSGHAILDEDLYLLCNETDYDDLISSAIEISTVKKILNRSPARHKVLILDCCHAGAAHKGAFKGIQDVQGMLNQVFQGTANVILCACARHERARELDKLDGGAGFLSWALATACTTRFQEASQDGHSLSLTKILHWLPKILDEINSHLTESERFPSPEALIYTKGGGEVWFTEPKVYLVQQGSHHEQYDKVDRLKVMLADHSGFMRDRLESFVGRQAELQEIQQLIAERLQRGGYISITGQAGQGKSSIIAKLIDEYGVEQVALHFIPFNPTPDHQVSLLRNIMARLILKYDLSDLYVASESRPALCECFPKVLTDVMEKGGQEVIFIDGLDQLKEDADGERDLSFLPNDVPPGIVFVLGTRPNDALRPLKLLKPHDEYHLPNLSRQNFDLILEHREVQLEQELADAFYRAMQENALYLDLVARELAEDKTVTPAAMMKQIADDPNNLFTVSMARLKRKPIQWREVIKPILGILLVAREPLSSFHIRQIIGTDDGSLREGLERLGGLLAQDGQHRYYLFHLKLQDYLRQDERTPEKEYVFASDEEEIWNEKLAQWCEQSSILTIWQDVKHNTGEQKRREYARKHYITHLYYARNWRRLFEILDTKQFGQAKVKYDPSTRSYVQDLDMGRKAAAWEGRSIEESIALFPRLWQYTLLRCNLISRADTYTLEEFEILVLLGHEQEALGLAELLTQPAYKAQIFVTIGKALEKGLERRQEALQLFMRAQETAETVGEEDKIAQLLAKISIELAQAQEWERAKAVAYIIKPDRPKEEVLEQLSKKLIHAQLWEQVETVIGTIGQPQVKEECNRELGIALAHARQWKRVQAVLFALESRGNRNSVLRELGVTHSQAQHWEQAEDVVRTLDQIEDRIVVLQELARALTDAHLYRRATAIWNELRRLAHRIRESDSRMLILLNLGKDLIQIRQWEQAEVIWEDILTLAHTVKINMDKKNILPKILKTLAEAQQWARAEIIAGIIIASKIKPGRVQILIDAFIQAGQWERAEAVAHSLDEGSGKTDALCELVRALAQAGQWERAEAVARSLDDEWVRIKGLQELVRALAQDGQWERAEAVARSLPNRWSITDTLGELGIALAQDGQWERAEAVVRSLDDAWVRNRVQQALGIALAQIGQQERSEMKRPEIIGDGVVPTHAIDMSKSQSIVFHELVRALARAGQWERAETITHSFTDIWDRNKALRELGIALAQAGQWERAEAVARSLDNAKVPVRSQPDAKSVVRILYDGKARSDILRVLGIALAQAGQWERAEMIIRSLHNVWDKNEVLRVLGIALAQAGQWERAEMIIRSLDDGWDKNEVLRVLGIVLARAGQWERAEAVARLQDIKAGSDILRELGIALAQAGQWERAEAVARLQDIKAGSDILRELGIALAQAGQWERAEAVAHSFKQTEDEYEVLLALAKELLQSQQWDLAKMMIHKIQGEQQQIRALKEFIYHLAKMKRLNKAEITWLETEVIAHSNNNNQEGYELLREVAVALAYAKEYEHLLRLVQRMWCQIETTEGIIELLPLATGFISLYPQIGSDFYEAFIWVDTFLKG